MADKKFDVIVVLGGGITAKGNLTEVTKSRVDKAVELYMKGVAPIIIMTGHKEADVMKAYAVRKSCSPESVLEEQRSKDTIGNAFFTVKNFLLPNNWRSLVIVTSIFHIARAKFIFRKVLGESYHVRFVPSVRVLSDKIFKKKLEVERGFLLVTKFLGALIADGDMEAVENFLKKHPLYNS